MPSRHVVEMNRAVLLKTNKSKSAVCFFHFSTQFRKWNLLFMRHMCDEAWNKVRKRNGELFDKNPYECRFYMELSISLHFLSLSTSWLNFYCSLSDKREKLLILERSDVLEQKKIKLKSLCSVISLPDVNIVERTFLKRRKYHYVRQETMLHFSCCFIKYLYYQ